MRPMYLMVLLLFVAGCAGADRSIPKDQEVSYHYRLGMAHLEDNNYQAAVLEFRGALKIEPRNSMVLFAIGHAYFLQKDYPGSEEMMLRLLKEMPDNGEAQNYLGNIYEQENRLPEAIEQFKKAAANPTYATPHFALHNLGRIYLLQHQDDLAEQAFISATQLVPEYYPVRADLAKFYLDREQWDKSIQEWRAVLDILPEANDAHFYLAKAYIGAKKKAEARKALETFLEKAAPDHPLRAEAQVLLGQVVAGQ